MAGFKYWNFWDIDFPPAHQLRQPHGDVLVILLRDMEDYVFCLPAEPFEKSMFWSPRFSSWKQEDCADLYATIKEANGAERKVPRLVLTHNRAERKINKDKDTIMESTFTLEAGLQPSEDCPLHARKQYGHDSLHLELLCSHFGGMGIHTSPDDCDKEKSYAPEFTYSGLAHGFIAHRGVPRLCGDALGTTCYERCKAVIAHKMLFVWLSGHSIDTSGREPQELAPLLTHVVALAELYDFLPQLAPCISREFRQCPKFWDDITIEPDFYLAIAVKLKDEVMFEEAPRHTAASTQKGRYLPVFRAVADTTGLAEQDVEMLITKYRYRLDKVVNDIDEIVVRHCQPDTYAKNQSISESMLFGKARSNAEYHKILFRMFFKQWYDGQCIAMRKERTYERYGVIKKIIDAKDYKPGDEMSVLGRDIHKHLTGTYTVSAATASLFKDQDIVRNPARFLSIYMATFFSQLSKELDQYLEPLPTSRVDTSRLTHFRFDHRNVLPWVEDTVKQSKVQPVLEAAGIVKRRKARTHHQQTQADGNQ